MAIIKLARTYKRKCCSLLFVQQPHTQVQHISNCVMDSILQWRQQQQSTLLLLLLDQLVVHILILFTHKDDSLRETVAFQ